MADHILPPDTSQGYPQSQATLAAGSNSQATSLIQDAASSSMRRLTARQQRRQEYWRQVMAKKESRRMGPKSHDDQQMHGMYDMAFESEIPPGLGSLHELPTSASSLVLPEQEAAQSHQHPYVQALLQQQRQQQQTQQVFGPPSAKLSSLHLSQFASSAHDTRQLEQLLAALQVSSGIDVDSKLQAVPAPLPALSPKPQLRRTQSTQTLLNSRDMPMPTPEELRQMLPMRSGAQYLSRLETQDVAGGDVMRPSRKRMLRLLAQLNHEVRERVEMIEYLVSELSKDEAGVETATPSVGAGRVGPARSQLDGADTSTLMGAMFLNRPPSTQ